MVAEEEHNKSPGNNDTINEENDTVMETSNDNIVPVTEQASTSHSGRLWKKRKQWYSSDADKL